LKKYSLNDLCTHAESKGGKCLSKEYEQSGTSYFWICNEGHEWSATWNTVQQGSWCRKCSYQTKNKKTGQEASVILCKMREHAITFGGKLLSTRYNNVSSLYHWRCEEGHEWMANWNNVRRGSWCKKCSFKAQNKKTGLKTQNIKTGSELEDVLFKMRECASSRGGELLSGIYKNALTKYRWRCELGHEWEATWANVFHSESWCKICAYKNPRKRANGNQGHVGRRVKFETIVEAVSKKGGKVISLREDYKNNKTKLRIECCKGHNFDIKYNGIQQGSWCPFCAGHKSGLPQLEEMARKFGGRLVSQEYLGVMRPHEWKCSEGHIFLKRPNAVKRGEWCSFCGDKISERVCRATFEALFQKPFPTLRPKWLASEKGRLELDGYNEQLRIAFEYHGSQHFEQNYFSKTKDDLKKRQEADKKKRELCRLNNVLLLEIPCKIPTLRIESYIKMLCIDNHLIDENHIGYHEPILKRAFSQTDLKRMQRLASLKGGRCISPAYVHAHHPLEWECENGHRWHTKPNRIQQGAWCPECRRLKRG